MKPYQINQELTKTWGIMTALLIISLFVAGLFVYNDIIDANRVRCIEYVVDGDTVILDSGDWVRINGIDAPETGDHAGEKAKHFANNALEGRCLEYIQGRSVVTGTERGTYERLIGDFRLENGQLFSAYMLENGHAVKFQ
ncbi:MAG: thermonuclease family protein [Bacteroidota bacterium]